MDATLRAYLERWKAVEEIERQELQDATLELRWRQLNAIYGLAIGLGIAKPPEDDIELIQRWAKLKAEATNSLPKK